MALTAEAARLGITTRFSATEAAQGMVILGRATGDAGIVLSTVEGTLRLAQAGALDLASAADITVGALRGFRLQVDQTGRIIDVLALASNSANTTVMELGEAIKFVAPIAAGLNVPLETTAAALGVLADGALKATLGGTGLRRVLGELENPATAARKVLERLNVSTESVRVSPSRIDQRAKALEGFGGHYRRCACNLRTTRRAGIRDPGQPSYRDWKS